MQFGHLEGFVAVEPAYWGSGYRPHATLGPAVRVKLGDTLPIRELSLVSLIGPSGHSRFSVSLS